jgi:hypothetical protein
VGIAFAFWVLWEGAEYGVYWLLGPSSAKTVDSLLPKSLVEILIWIATSITAVRRLGVLQWPFWRRDWCLVYFTPIKVGRM